MQQVWNLPGPARPGYFPRLGRCLLFLIVLVVGLVVTTWMTSLGVFTNQGVIWTILLDTVAAIANGLMFLLVFRVLTPKGVPTSNLVWGAAAGGVAWTVMQALGNFLVGHYLHNDRSVYGVFATVLGLVVWVYILVQITVYAAEINVVLTRRLWPRAIVQPPLTEADRAVMAAQALQNQRREEQQVKVTYDRPASTERSATTPQTPQEIIPPAEPTPRGVDVDAREGLTPAAPGRAEAGTAAVPCEAVLPAPRRCPAGAGPRYHASGYSQPGPGAGGAPANLSAWPTRTWRAAARRPPRSPLPRRCRPRTPVRGRRCDARLFQQAPADCQLWPSPPSGPADSSRTNRPQPGSHR
jgi:hypothetical protein